MNTYVVVQHVVNHTSPTAAASVCCATQSNLSFETLHEHLCMGSTVYRMHSQCVLMELDIEAME